MPDSCRPIKSTETVALQGERSDSSRSSLGRTVWPLVLGEAPGLNPFPGVSMTCATWTPPHFREIKYEDFGISDTLVSFLAPLQNTKKAFAFDHDGV